MKTFMTGLALGLGLGIAFAPEPGTFTRSKIKRKAEDVTQEFLPQQPQASENANERILQSSSGNSMHGEVTSARTSQQTGSSQDEVAEVLNNASKNELMSVDGIGKATAKRIIKNRPYENAADAAENEVVPESTLENLKETLIKGEDVA